MREGKKIYLKEFLMKSQRNLADYFFKMAKRETVYYAGITAVETEHSLPT